MYNTPTEQADAKKVDDAFRLSLNPTQQNLDIASEKLLSVIHNTPTVYVYKFVEKNKLFVKSWDKFDFTHFSTSYEEANKYDEILWLLSAYPRAYYYMGIVLTKYDQLNLALQCYKKGMELEKSNPHFLIAIGNVFGKMKNYSQAVEFYRLIGDVNPYVSPRIKALALRSEGVQLIELNELEKAKIAFMKSLDLEPNNQNAINELLYIDQIELGTDNSKAPMITQLNFPMAKCIYCGNEVTDGRLKIINGEYKYICKNCITK
jgi:tetratricopeptide (TPR) repeat protein